MASLAARWTVASFFTERNLTREDLMKPLKAFWGALAGACLLATPALAQIDATRVEPEAGIEDPQELPPLHVTANVGIADYTGNLGANTQVGPLYGVTVGAEQWDLVGVEAGYEGTTNSVSGDGTGSVVRHDVNALLKAGPSFDLAQNDLHPYVGLGLGVSYVNPTDEAEASGLRTDFLGELPLAAGVEYQVGMIRAGVRGTYRVLFFDEFAEPTPSADNPSGGLLSGQLTVGGQF
jgi:hypothetical protein